MSENARLLPVSMPFFSALNKQYILENFGFEAKEFELTDVARQKR